MKWQGRRQSTNVEDKQLDDVYIPEGTKVFVNSMADDDGTPDGYKTFSRKDPKAKEWDDLVRATKDIARRGDKVPTPTPKPSTEKTHDNLVTPGKWKTKTKKK